jgi:predicted short-subunit dehydrogenase-like oxidoreductase (DUF2520 family)
MSDDLSIGITLIGAGRVGMNILRHFRGRNMEICAVVEPRIERHPAIRSAAPSARVLTGLPPALPQNTDICILAVPDEEIRALGEALADRPMLHSGALVFHVSGLRGAEELQPLQEIGCHAGCLHPMQSFPEQPLPPERLVGIGCGIEGPDDFWTRARDFAELLGWMPLRVNAQSKALYHAACVFAGNFSTVVAAHAERLLRAATGRDENLTDYLLPMLESVVARLRDHPAEQVLTGPAVRGDARAVDEHLQALASAFPDLREEYRLLSAAILQLSTLPEEKKRELRARLDAHD